MMRPVSLGFYLCYCLSDENFQLFSRVSTVILRRRRSVILCHSYTDPFFNQFSARVGVGWEADRIVFSLGYLNGPPNEVWII